MALGWLCTPESMPSICLQYGLGVALGGFARPPTPISAFYFLLSALARMWLWVAGSPFSFEVRCSTFDAQPPAGTSNTGKPPPARLPQAWLIFRSPAEAGGAPGDGCHFRVGATVCYAEHKSGRFVLPSLCDPAVIPYE